MAGWKVYAIHDDPVARAKVIVDRASDRIVGAHLYGSGGGEEIHLFAYAIHFGITADDLRRSVYRYPTLASALPYALG